MIAYFDVEDAPNEDEVLLFCTVRSGEQVTCLARLHWFALAESDQTCRQGWQSTWDGREIPSEWTPYAWALFEAPDPAAAPT